jgi:DNA-binding NtrC family response regulator
VTTAVIVEDDILASMALTHVLEAEGYLVQSFTCTDPAYAYSIAHPPDILIADWSVPGDVSSADLALAIKNINPSLRVIFISGHESTELREIVDHVQDAECLAKPIHFERFISDIRGDFR